MGRPPSKPIPTWNLELETWNLKLQTSFPSPACTHRHGPLQFLPNLMLICLDSSIISGYLSNEVPGLVTGMFHLAGQERPLRIELTGNFLRDIAGCSIELHNPIPEADLRHIARLSPHQYGYVGQMTASYRVLKGPRSRKHAGPFTEPEGLKNLLFLEWFNVEKQRVLMQSWHLKVTVAAPRWQLSPQAEKAQIRQNRARRKQFLLGGRETTILEADNPASPNAGPQSAGDLANVMDSPPNDAKAAAASPFGTSFALINQATGELSLELRRFEALLASPGELQSRPAVLRLLATAGDLAAHLSHALKNFASLKSTQWQFLLTDLEQSLPLFHAALVACDKLVEQTAPGTDLRWMMGVQRSLLSITCNIEQLMKWLRYS